MLIISVIVMIVSIFSWWLYQYIIPTDYIA